MRSPISLHTLFRHYDSSCQLAADGEVGKSEALLSDEWEEMIIKHPDRFIMGFDNVFAFHWRKRYLYMTFGYFNKTLRLIKTELRKNALFFPLGLVSLVNSACRWHAAIVPSWSDLAHCFAR